MTSKEAITNIKFMLERTGNLVFYEEEIEAIKKDLEVLEILENRISLKEDTIKGAHFIINEIGLPEIETDTKDYDVAFIEASGFVFKNSEEYTLLKEWLRDE